MSKSIDHMNSSTVVLSPSDTQVPSTTPAWTLPTSTLRTLPTSGTNITGIYIGVGALLGIGGLILLVFIVTIVYCFKHHWYRKSNPNNSIELKKYQNVVGEAPIEVDGENGDSFYEPDYQPTADDPSHVPNPVYISSATERPIPTENTCVDSDVQAEPHVPNPVYISSATERPTPTENTCGDSNVQADIPRAEHKPASILPNDGSSDVQQNIPGIPPPSSDFLTHLASQGATPSDPVMESLTTKMKNDLMQLGYTNERSDSLSFQAATQPMNLAHPTSSDGGNAVQPTALPPEEIIYDNIVSPPALTDGDDHESVKEKEVECDPSVHDPIYDDPKVLPKDLQQPVEVTNDNITEISELGNGHFGKVMLAATQGLSLKDMRLSKTDDNRDASILVAVKKLIDHPSKAQRESFIKESKFMSSLNHQNVVRLIGVCYDEPAFMMMEYMEEGDLNEFLQRYSEIVETPSNNTQISTSTVVYMASQIASAMKYLASLNFIHRDIASRNCLVGNNFSVKLADFGMSRNLYESHYYQMQGKTALPIRWMATECFYGLFTEKSDVWAFGVTMWELFILAKEAPYSDLSDEEIIIDATKLKGAHRQLLPRPSACPIPVYNIMRRCWAIDPEKRAKFEEVEKMLQTYMVST